MTKKDVTIHIIIYNIVVHNLVIFNKIFQINSNAVVMDVVVCYQIIMSRLTGPCISFNCYSCLIFIHFISINRAIGRVNKFYPNEGMMMNSIIENGDIFAFENIYPILPVVMNMIEGNDAIVYMIHIYSITIFCDIVVGNYMVIATHLHTISPIFYQKISD